ncbi:hypothetical protein EES37_15970 [Streptomyces sp. ADI91-18]|nr:hypothetical protein EES37_15970 [Streptomyces sp. ADI91-18]
MEAARRKASNHTGGPRRIHTCERGDPVLNRTRGRKPVQSAETKTRVQLLAAAIQGVFSGASRAGTKWVIRDKQMAGAA